jgi:hypothetical protein
VFDKYKFHYWYDTLDVNGHTLAQVNDMIKEMQSHGRVFAGLVLNGFKTSAKVSVSCLAILTGTRILQFV